MEAPSFRDSQQHARSRLRGCKGFLEGKERGSRGSYRNRWFIPWSKGCYRYENKMDGGETGQAYDDLWDSGLLGKIENLDDKISECRSVLFQIRKAGAQRGAFAPVHLVVQHVAAFPFGDFVKNFLIDDEFFIL